MQNFLCSSWMQIVTVACGFVRRLCLSINVMAKGVKYYPKWLCANCHAGQLCWSRVCCFEWILFLSLSKWKIPPQSMPEVKVLKMCRCLSICLPFITQRYFSTLCCCCTLFLAVGAPNFLNHWTSQVLDDSSLQCLILALSLLHN